MKAYTDSRQRYNDRDERVVLYTVAASEGNLSAWYRKDSDVDWLAIELGHRAADRLRGWR